MNQRPPPPAAYRPFLQSKKTPGQAAPPVYRPDRSTPQLKPAFGAAAPPIRLLGPPAYRPTVQPKFASGVIQRAAKSTLNDDYDDAMAEQNWDLADQIEKKMNSLPGDRMPKTFGAKDEDDYDLTYKSTQIRFSFATGLRGKLTAAQTKGGKLYCALGPSCYVDPVTSEIKVDGSGKEVWNSVSGNEHKTKPPIDHYNQDWKDRLAALIKKGYDVQTFAVKGKEAYNADSLRIIHMKCNSKRNGS